MPVSCVVIREHFNVGPFAKDYYNCWNHNVHYVLPVLPLRSGVTNRTNGISTHYTINYYKNIYVYYISVYIHTYTRICICT